MNAVVMDRPGAFEIRDIPLKALAPDEVLIRIKASGICTNDMRDFRGECSYSYPRIGGHEYCGVIEELGEAVNPQHFHVGQRAVNYIIDHCRECYYCKHGEENICEGLPFTKTFLNPGGISGYAGFAEYVIAKAANLFIYPDDTPFEKMAFTEPLACVVNSFHRVNVQLGDDVVVIGGGPMGQLHVMVAKLRGARVILSEPQEERRARARTLGCDAVVDPTACDPVERVRALTGGRGANVVFNTTAIPGIAKQAVEMTSPGGTCVAFSSMHPNDPVPVDFGAVHSYQKTITGAVSPSVLAFQQATFLIGKGILDPSPLIEQVFDYHDFGRAMETALRPDTYKVIIAFDAL